MPRQRLTAAARRQQLINVARHVFAQRGLDGTSVEELAKESGVSKPVIYEHFGGKEGLYDAVIEQDTTALDDVLATAIHQTRSRLRIERTALALLEFAEKHEDSFRILTRDSGNAAPTLLSESASRASHVLAEAFTRNNLNPALAALYAHAMVGAVSMAAQWWATTRENLNAQGEHDKVPAKEVVAAHVVNLLWNGLAGMEASPILHEEVEGEEGELGARFGAGRDADPAQKKREKNKRTEETGSTEPSNMTKHD